VTQFLLWLKISGIINGPIFGKLDENGKRLPTGFRRKVRVGTEIHDLWISPSVGDAGEEVKVGHGLIEGDAGDGEVGETVVKDGYFPVTPEIAREDLKKVGLKAAF
jgi:hypothetical protein